MKFYWVKARLFLGVHCNLTSFLSGLFGLHIFPNFAFERLPARRLKLAPVPALQWEKTGMLTRNQFSFQLVKNRIPIPSWVTFRYPSLVYYIVCLKLLEYTVFTDFTEILTILTICVQILNIWRFFMISNVF